VASDSLTVCSGQSVTFTVSNPEAGTTYNWFNTATDGTAVHSGNTHTVANLTDPVEFWVEGITTLGCRSINRTYVEAVDLAPLAQAPVLRVDSLGTRAIRFEWDAVPGATGYQVSRDGVTWTNPSSGPTGLTHTITGLNPKDTASLVVKALGLIECQSRLSARVQGTTLENPYFIPNTFTPNGNGKNDVFRITSVAVQSLRLMIFNQWGEKVFETSTPQQGWDGTYKGKQQPIGVYVYAARIVLTDGTVDNVKGTFNLVR
jgi:gliding motility-associated-like protein